MNLHDFCNIHRILSKEDSTTRLKQGRQKWRSMFYTCTNLFYPGLRTSLYQFILIQTWFAQVEGGGPDFSHKKGGVGKIRGFFWKKGYHLFSSLRTFSNVIFCVWVWLIYTIFISLSCVFQESLKSSLI